MDIMYYIYIIYLYFIYIFYLRSKIQHLFPWVIMDRKMLQSGPARNFCYLCQALSSEDYTINNSV